MDENQKQKHTKNDTDFVTKKTNVVSPMLWENFDETQNLSKDTKNQQIHTSSATENISTNLNASTEKYNTLTEKTDILPSLKKADSSVAEDISTKNIQTEITSEQKHISFTEENLDETKIISPISQENSSVQSDQKQTITPNQTQERGSFSDILQKIEKKHYTDDLGDKNAYLDTFESECFEEEEYSPQNHTLLPKEEHEQQQDASLEEDDSYYDEETSMALYQAERKKIKLLLLVAVCIGLSVFLVGYMIMGANQRKLLEQQAKIEAEKAAAAKKIDKRHMMVQNITTNRELVVHDINTDKEYTVKTNSQTKFIDRSGEQASMTRIQKGDLISVVFEEDGQTAKEIRYSGDTWMAKEVSGLSVNTETKTVSITFVNGTEPKQYYYTEDNLFLYKDTEIAPENIASCDVITMQGQDDRVWSIRVIEYHGTMTIANQEQIQNGFLSIDGGEPIALEGFTKLEIPEGPHTISVSGENIESFEDMIFIVPGETFEYDLSKAQSKTGVMIIRANVYDFKLYINGADTDGTKPIVLPLGEYDVVVLKNGYKQWNQKVTVVEPSVTVEVNMEEDIQEGIISFHSTPEGASVIYNDTQIGITPFEQKVRYGIYTVEVLLEGYQPHLETIVVDKPAVSSMSDLTLQQETAANNPSQ